MTEKQITLQPGMVFYDVFRACLRLRGLQLKDFAAANGINVQNARNAACGTWNGPAAKELRQKMLVAVGEDVFRRAYADRMAFDGLDRGAA